MKKTLSIILACLMLVACIPFSASAANVTWSSATGVVSTSTTINNGDTVSVTGTYTITGVLTIAAGASFVIEAGATVTVSGYGRIINNGEIVVKNNGTLNLTAAGTGIAGAALVNNGNIEVFSKSVVIITKNACVYNYNNISNANAITVIGNLYHEVTIMPSFSYDYAANVTYDRKPRTVKYTVSYVLDLGNGLGGADNDPLADDLAYADPTNYKTVGDIEKKVWVRNGETMYILITPEAGAGDWVDTSRMKITTEDVVIIATKKIGNNRGVFSVVPTNATRISAVDPEYKDVVKLFTIELPETEAYYFVSVNGDAVDNVTVEYGKKMSFRVVLNPDYDQSTIDVYADDVHLDPDEFGYYDITGPIGTNGMATEGGVQNDVKITILGVVSNDRQNQMNNIISFVKQIFSIIQSFFDYFKDLFAGIGSGLGGSIEA